MQPCRSLDGDVPAVMDMQDLVQLDLNTVAAYKECASRHQSLIEWWTSSGGLR